MSLRESRNGGGDLHCECQKVTGSKGNEWFVVWERGETETHVGVRVNSDFPVDMVDSQ